AWSNKVVVVAAAGNNGSTVPQYPAACDHVLGVAASEPDDSRSWFSSYGSYVTLFAPGDNIWTTQRDLSNPYGAWSGTSFSSPVVAGVAALVFSVNPALSNGEIVDVLKQSADDLGPAGYDATYAYGRVNAFRAVSAVGPSTPSIAPEVPPTVEPPATVSLVSTNSPAETVVRSVTYVMTGPLIVQTNGLGTGVPNLDGRQLEVGRTYRIRAVPGPGQVFAGWNGGLSSDSATLSFTMQTNLALAANFVTNPFPAVHGTYSGLVANAS